MKVDPNRMRTIIIGILFLTGAGYLGLHLGAGDFLGDEYNAMLNVHRPLREYMKTFHYGTLVKLQFWLCDRMFDRSLAGYRIPGLISAVLNLAVVLFLMPRLWPSKWVMILCVSIMLIFNNQIIYYARYGMATYAESIFLSTILLFLFLRLLDRPLTRTGTVWVVVFFCVFPWVSVLLSVPFAIGFVLLAGLRIRASCSGDPRRIRRTLLELKYFAVGFAMIAVTRIRINPETWKRRAYHPNNNSYFFPTSGYPLDFQGALQFGWDRFAGMLRDLLSTVSGYTHQFRPGIQFDQVLLTVSYWLLAIGIAGIAVPVLFRRKIDSRRLFLAGYFGFFIISTYLLSLIRLYPFGKVRYGLFMILPVLMICGYALEDMVRILIVQPARFLGSRLPGRGLRRVNVGGLAKVSLLLLTVAAAGIGLDRLIHVHRYWTDMREQYDSFIRFVQESDAEVVLIDMRRYHFWPILAPDQYRRKVDLNTMGGRQIGPRKEFIRRMRSKDCDVDEVLFIIQGYPWDEVPEDQFPAFRNLFSEREFRVVESRSIPGHYYATRAVRIRTVAELEAVTVPFGYFLEQAAPVYRIFLPEKKISRLRIDPTDEYGARVIVQSCHVDADGKIIQLPVREPENLVMARFEPMGILPSGGLFRVADLRGSWFEIKSARNLDLSGFKNPVLNLRMAAEKGDFFSVYWDVGSGFKAKYMCRMVYERVIVPEGGGD